MYFCLPVILSQFTKGKIKQYLVAVLWFFVVSTKRIHVGFPLFFWCVWVNLCHLFCISISVSTALKEGEVMHFFRSSEQPQREWDKMKEKKPVWISWDGATWDLKGVEKFCCSNKVHVSDVNIMCWGNVTHVCNWLLLAGQAQLETWKTDVAFNQARVRAGLELGMSIFFHPKMILG